MELFSASAVIALAWPLAGEGRPVSILLTQGLDKAATDCVTGYIVIEASLIRHMQAGATDCSTALVQTLIA